jgi:hypothetical protein
VPGAATEAKARLGEAGSMRDGAERALVSKIAYARAGV